jgi:hypothetical protein
LRVVGREREEDNSDFLAGEQMAHAINFHEE